MVVELGCFVRQQKEGARNFHSTPPAAPPMQPPLSTNPPQKVSSSIPPFLHRLRAQREREHCIVNVKWRRQEEGGKERAFDVVLPLLPLFVGQRETCLLGVVALLPCCTHMWRVEIETASSVHSEQDAMAASHFASPLSCHGALRRMRLAESENPSQVDNSLCLRRHRSHLW